MHKNVKIYKKRLKKQFSSVRSRRHRREVVNEIVRIFQVVESFMEIQDLFKWAKTLYCLLKSQKNDYKTSKEKQSLHLLFHDDAHLTQLSAVSLFGQCNEDNKKSKE